MPRTKRACRGKSAKWPGLETDLKTWVVDHRSSALSVTTSMILHEARKIAKEKKITDFTGTFSGFHA